MKKDPGRCARAPTKQDNCNTTSSKDSKCLAVKNSEHLLPNWAKNTERGVLIIGYPGHTLGKWPGYEPIQVPKSPTGAIEQSETKNPKEGKDWKESPGTRIYRVSFTFPPTLGCDNSTQSQGGEMILCIHRVGPKGIVSP